MENGYSLSDKPICIGSDIHRYQIQDDAELIGIPVRCILEPVSRNTAAAMAVIACYKASENSDLLVFCPSDHYIQNTESYLQSLLTGFNAINSSEIITLGVNRVSLVPRMDISRLIIDLRNRIFIVLQSLLKTLR